MPVDLPDLLIRDRRCSRCGRVTAHVTLSTRRVVPVESDVSARYSLSAPGPSVTILLADGRVARATATPDGAEVGLRVHRCR